MKIRDKSIEANPELTRANDGTIVKGGRARSSHINEQRHSDEDTVNVKLSKRIQEELKPSSRIEELKALIEAGQYNPDLNKVAKSVTDYIDEEVDFEKIAR